MCDSLTRCGFAQLLHLMLNLSSLITVLCDDGRVQRYTYDTHKSKIFHTFRSYFFVATHTAQAAQPMLFKWATWAMWAPIKKYSLMYNRARIFTRIFTSEHKELRPEENSKSTILNITTLHKPHLLLQTSQFSCIMSTSSTSLLPNIKHRVLIFSSIYLWTYTL